MNLPLVIVRAVYFLAVLQLFGLLNFDLWFGRVRPRQTAAALVAVALLASLAWLALVAADMSGQAASPNAVSAVLRDTRFGELWIARVALLLVAALLPWRVLSAIVAGLVLALTAAAGHAGAENNPLQLGGDVIHLLAAGAWLGGLAPFAWAMRREDADVVALRFSTLGTVCVGLIIVTGAMNSWFLVGGPRGLVGTDYGRVLLAKLALFVVLLAIAAINRFRLTPRGDTGTLRRNALIETALGVAIVAVVAMLGTMAPGYHGGG